METLALIVSMVAVTYKVTDLIKLQWPTVAPGIVQAVSWVLGIAVALLLAQTQLASAIQLGSFTLDKANIFDVIVFGFAIGSGASAFNDGLASVDNARSSSARKAA